MTKRKNRQRTTRANPVYFYTAVNGYERIDNNYDGEEVRFTHHRLLAIAKGHSPHKIFSGDYHVHHKNGVRWDNREENIELLTAEEHKRHHAKERGFGNEYHYTEDELLSWIEAFVEEFGIPPTSADIHNWPGPTHVTYRDRFGTITNAIRAAGYTPRGENNE